ncbi:lasso RiPP family leader peptide-containing protein [Micromonospora sp. PSH25]|nr:lasso RiPP family leader peptide-containing protein [Micromonospora foliorum]
MPNRRRPYEPPALAEVGDFIALTNGVSLPKEWVDMIGWWSAT